MADSFRPLYYVSPEELRPTKREWLRHAFLFVLTFLSATVAGTLAPFGRIAYWDYISSPSAWFEWFFLIPYFFWQVFTIFFKAVTIEPALLIEGVFFSASLLAILTAHEFGHYIACRLYGVKATLPFYLPLPVISPAGTLGAVIKIQSPLPSRRAVFDIGVAGPLAGFAVIIPVAIVGLLTMQTAPVAASAVDAGGVMTFTDPLLTRFLGMLLGVDPTNGVMNPFYAAAWVGTLITSLNLLPAGQLDGGHAFLQCSANEYIFGQGASPSPQWSA